MEKLLSIIIPTKNRYQTLGPVINGILPYLSSQIEIVIQDNSEDNSEYFDLGIQSDLVRYDYTSYPIPISDNTIKAIENAKGKYLLFIGDDDFVTPYINRIITQINDLDVSCLTYAPGYYWWNSVSFLRPNYYEDREHLLVEKKLSMTIQELDTKEQLNKVLNRGAVDYTGLPRFYHGIVKKEILLKIKERLGSFLIGSCPDMAFSVELSMELNRHYFMSYPVTIFGASKGSGGGMTANKTHFMNIEDATFLRKNIVEVWNSNIPRVWSQKTIYPQTTSEVLDAYNSKLKINYIAFYASMFIYEPYLIHYLNPFLKKHIFSLYLYKQIIRKSVGYIWRWLRTVFPNKKVRIFCDVKPETVYKILESLNCE